MYVMCVYVYVITRQDIGGGKPVPISSPMGELPLWGLEIDPEAARAELRQVMADDGGKKLNETLDQLGMTGVVEQLRDLQLGELLDTPPPGVDEAVAIAKVRVCVCVCVCAWVCVGVC